MSHIKNIWEEGKRFEIDFWKIWIDEKGGHWSDDFKKRLDPELLIEEHVENFLRPIPGTPSVLDVGAGPLTVLGKKMRDGRTIRISAVDPLAAQYNEMFEKASIIPLVKTQYAEVETLDMFCSTNEFDLVHMRNALDHSYDPLLGIRQMVKAVKPGRVVLLEHSTNEAEKANYGAFHQWNICVNDNELILWNKDQYINVTHQLTGIAKVIAWGNSEWTSAVIEKKG